MSFSALRAHRCVDGMAERFDRPDPLSRLSLSDQTWYLREWLRRRGPEMAPTPVYSLNSTVDSRQDYPGDSGPIRLFAEETMRSRPFRLTKNAAQADDRAREPQWSRVAF